MKRPSYRAAVRWVALNDEPEERDASATERMISVALVADLFGVERARVARDVLAERVRRDVLSLSTERAYAERAE